MGTLTDINRAVVSLAGIVEGISMDNRITVHEKNFLIAWIQNYSSDIANEHFSPLLQKVNGLIQESYLSDADREFILEVCARYSFAHGVNTVEAKLVEFFSIWDGISADGRYSIKELVGFIEWIRKQEEIWDFYPVKETVKIFNKVIRDGVIEQYENDELQKFFSIIRPQSAVKNSM